MPTYVAFLRAINLGATRKFPKDAIRAAVEAAGGMDVETYINTGNVRFRHGVRSRERAEAVLEEAFLADRGFEVPTIAYTPAELAAIAADADELAGSLESVGGHYVTLLKTEPPAGLVVEVDALEGQGEVAALRGRALHVVVAKRAAYNFAILKDTGIEKRLGVGTTRNATVIRTLVAKWC